ncbi:hypothetical protein ACFFRR_010425 [Megaselia abdita]
MQGVTLLTLLTFVVLATANPVAEPETGPADSSIVQTAKELSDDKPCCKRHAEAKPKNKRSSFVIYRPMGLEEFLKSTANALNHNINKRSILDKDTKKNWYEGETVPFLVRPAPRGRPVKDVFLAKRSSNSDPDDFWYSKDDEKLDDSLDQGADLVSESQSTQSNNLSKIRGKIANLKDIFGLKKLSDNIDFFTDYDRDNNWLAVFGKPSSANLNTNSFFSNSHKSSVFGDSKIPSLIGSAKKLFGKDDEYDDDVYFS